MGQKTYWTSMVMCGFLLYLQIPRVDMPSFEVLIGLLCLLALYLGISTPQRLTIWMAPFMGVLVLIIEKLLVRLFDLGGDAEHLSLASIRYLLFDRILPLSPFWSNTVFYFLGVGVLSTMLLVCLWQHKIVIDGSGKWIGAISVIALLGMGSATLSVTAVVLHVFGFAVIAISLMTVIVFHVQRLQSIEALLLAVAFEPLWINLNVIPGLGIYLPMDLAGSPLTLYVVINRLLPIVLFLIIIPTGSLLTVESNRRRWILISSTMAVLLAVLSRVWLSPQMEEVSYIRNPTAVAHVIYLAELSPITVIESLYAILLMLPLFFINFLRRKVQVRTSSNTPGSPSVSSSQGVT